MRFSEQCELAGCGGGGRVELCLFLDLGFYVFDESKWLLLFSLLKQLSTTAKPQSGVVT